MSSSQKDSSQTVLAVDNSASSKSNARIKFTVLILLCCQNAGHALLARYSQGVLKERYSSSEVVLVGEIMKLFISAYLIQNDTSQTDSSGVGFGKLLWLASHSSKIVVLVIFYAISNILSYYALARVDASVYTVMLQLKILSTAGFAVCFLKRYISSTKWRALTLLVIGCILVASPAYNKPVDCSAELVEAAPEHHTMAESTLGVGAVLVMVTVSGYSSVYFEGMLKKTGEKLTIWERNFQLALYSSFLLIFVVLSEIEDYNIREHQFFTGWTINTVMIAIVQAGGGLLVAATLKYADAVLKTLATSGAIVLSAVLGKMFLGGTLDIFVGLGACGTILAIFNYTLDSTPAPSSDNSSVNNNNDDSKK